MHEANVSEYVTVDEAAFMNYCNADYFTSILLEMLMNMNHNEGLWII